MSASTRSQVVSNSQNGLAKEGITASKKSRCLLLKRFHSTGSVADKRSTRPRRSRANRLDEHYRFIDECMAEDDKLAAAIAKVLSRAMRLKPADYTRRRSGCPRATHALYADFIHLSAELYCSNTMHNYHATSSCTNQLHPLPLHAEHCRVFLSNLLHSNGRKYTFPSP